MADQTIENPIINSPFREPGRHFRFSDEGITNEVVDKRHISLYGLPVAETNPADGTRQNGLDFCCKVDDTDSREQKMAQVLEGMPGMLRYVKNQNLGFTIPYTTKGDERAYTPDFIAVFDDGNSTPLHLILELTGAKDRDKEAKVDTAWNLWVPAVNAHGGLGRWAFLEIANPRNVIGPIGEVIRSVVPAVGVTSGSNVSDKSVAF